MSDEPRSWHREALIALGGVSAVRTLGATWRIRVVHGERFQALRAARQPIIFVHWHGQLLPLLFQHRGEGVTVLISEHADGEIIARAAERLGFRTVRGSTSRGAARALLGLVRAAREGHDLAITPDGPRGPAHTVAPGTLVVAQRTKAAIVPVAVAASSAWRLKSWDAFMIPKPFARVTVSYGEPIYIEQADVREAVAESGRVAAALAAAEQAANV
ncbi:MAG TPA: lysophospholipid acyltransferase family protein [Gemmatimonadaceae bacterium]|jgi:hypothetical protein